MDIISTWIYLDKPEESSEYPQVGKGSHLPEFQKVYWRCVTVFFALSTQNNPENKHILFSNAEENDLPIVDGLDVKHFLKERNVELITLPLTWQTPKGYFGKWRNQFYIFDILAFMESYSSQNLESLHDYALIVLDSDCLINRSLDGLFKEIHQSGLMVLPMHFAADYDINGVTRADMRRIFSELDKGIALDQNPEYFGGEVFAATKATIEKINLIAPRVWKEMLERYRKGEQKLNEEAHFLSYCYHRIGQYASIEKYIRRIWTSPKFNNVEQADVNLSIWHLPAEKTGGIAIIFNRIKKGQGLGDLNQLGGLVGVPKRRKYLDLKHFLKHSWVYKRFK